MNKRKQIIVDTMLNMDYSILQERLERITGFEWTIKVMTE